MDVVMIAFSFQYLSLLTPLHFIQRRKIEEAFCQRLGYILTEIDGVRRYWFIKFYQTILVLTSARQVTGAKISVGSFTTVTLPCNIFFH